MNDKILHFSFSFFLVMTFAHFIDFHWAFLLTLFTGFMKETYDFHSPHHVADEKDMLFNYMGALSAYLILPISIIF